MAGYKVWTRERLTAAELQGFLQDQVVMRFPSDAARTAALPVGSREQGMLTFRAELGGVYEAWNAASTSWEVVAALTPPYIQGALTRSDGVNTVNGPNNYTDLKTVPVDADTVGTWATYSHPNGVGHTCALPGRYLVTAALATDIAGPRAEEMMMLGTRAATLGTGGAPGGAGGTYGGAGGSDIVRAPSGLSVAFRYANFSATVAGTIRSGRYSITWLGPV